jgi:hypothetical protein
MGGVGPRAPRKNLDQLVVDLIRVARFGQTEPLRNAEDMGIDGDGLDPERVAQHHIGCLEADPGQRDQRFPGARDLATVVSNQGPSHAED